VPPVADALHVTGLPVVALAHVTVICKGWAPIVTLAEPVPVLPPVSVAVAVMVWMPLVAKVVVKLVPEPAVGPPLGADQENE